MKTKIFISILALLIVITYAYSDENTQIVEWNETIKFGIPSAKQNVVFQIREKKIKESYSILNKILSEETNRGLLLNTLNVCIELDYRGADELIIKLIDSQDLEVRIKAISAVGQLKIESIIPKLRELLNKNNNNIRLRATVISALGELKDEKSLENFYEIFSKSRETIIKESIILAVGKIGSTTSIEFLKNQYENLANTKFIRFYAVSSLGNMDTDEVLDVLEKALLEDDITMNIRAIDALGKINSEKSWEILSGCLSNQNSKIRTKAIDVLAEKKINKYIDHLFFIIKNDPNIPTRKSAVNAITKIGGESVVNFIRKNLIEEKNDEISPILIVNLPNLEPNTAFDILKKVYENENEINKKKLILNSIMQIEDNVIFGFLEKIIKTEKIDEDSFKLIEIVLGNLMRNENVNGISLYQIGISSENEYVRAKAVYFSSYHKDAVKLKDDYINLLAKSEDYDEIYLLLKTIEKLEIEVSDKKLTEKLKKHPDATIKRKAILLFD